MPDFVKQGESEHLDTDTTSPNDNNDSRPQLDAEEEPTERKSLYQQLKEDKELKQQLFQQQFDSQNSGYKLDEKSANYYDGLLKEKQKQQVKAKISEQMELSRFKALKLAKKPSSLPPAVASNKIVKKKTAISPPVQKIKSPALPKPEPKAPPIVGDYSSDDDD